MKPFEEQIKELRKGSQSISNISKESNDLFKRKYSPEGSGGRLEFNGDFIPGKFYTCEYKTKTKVSEKTPFIDSEPVFIFL